MRGGILGEQVHNIFTYKETHTNLGLDEGHLSLCVIENAPFLSSVW